MSSPTGFHVRHDLRPNLTYELLLIFRSSPSGLRTEKIEEVAHMNGYELRHRKSYGKLLSSLSELGLIQQIDKQMILSETGRVVADIVAYQPQLLTELIHFLYYTAWHQDSNNRFSWSYQTLCNMLWHTSPGSLDTNHLVNSVIQRAQDQFGLHSISFSISSVSGILNWISGLQPPCLYEKDNSRYFVPRTYCPVEVFALALNHIYQRSLTDDGNYVPVSAELRGQVCEICLLAYESFAEMLEQAESCFEALHVRRERGERFSMADFSWQTLNE